MITTAGVFVSFVLAVVVGLACFGSFVFGCLWAGKLFNRQLGERLKAAGVKANKDGTLTENYPHVETRSGVN